MASKTTNCSRLLLSAIRPSSRTLGIARHVRFKRYEAFDAQFHKETLREARSWFQAFDASKLPRGSTTYSRSSGPGGQHVNKTETKATTVYGVNELLSLLPKNLHSGIRCSRYYVANNDSLTFHEQSQRSRTANENENRRKLVEEIKRIYHSATPAETSVATKKKYEIM
ncbi:hypothetical protein E4U42_008034 [Claviceps africana]|uniref:Prokaryotic-type class I peptide chain release factors domain-containing protein n=1 Tax=Claviceps africana TaxID=83212 RepID=A0A8K0JAN3_9HYPO|nr:hypothetical protein E4U42_008034 [Claviceps africana]